MNVRATCLFFALLTGSVLAQPVETPRVAQLDEADQPALGLGLAESLLLQGQFGEAEKLALRALESEPDNLRALVILTKVAIARRDLPKAQGLVNKLIEVDSEVADHQALYGMVAMFANDHPRAIEALNKALELGQGTMSPGQMASYANTLVLAYHKAGQPEEAIQTCLQAIESYPQDADLYLSASRLYREAGRYQEALQVAQEGLLVRPDFTNLYASVALAEAALGHKELSEQAYQQLLQRDPELAKALRATLDGTRADSAEYKVRVD